MWSYSRRTRGRGAWKLAGQDIPVTLRKTTIEWLAIIMLNNLAYQIYEVIVVIKFKRCFYSVFTVWEWDRNESRALLNKRLSREILPFHNNAWAHVAQLLTGSFRRFLEDVCEFRSLQWDSEGLSRTAECLRTCSCTFEVTFTGRYFGRLLTQAE